MNKKMSVARSIEEKIFLMRGTKVMLDTHLAELYGVKVKVLSQAVKRNWERFPEDFMFQLTKSEFEILRSQFVTSSWGGRRFIPNAFTEQGVAMLSSVLNSRRAIHVNIQIMRTFIRLKEMLTSHKDLQRKIKSLERKFEGKFAIVFHAIQKLFDGPKRKFKVKGFKG